MVPLLISNLVGARKIKLGLLLWFFLYAIYADMAREFGLAASRGSDFHSPQESHTDLGQLPPLPTGLTPVWELLQPRIVRA